MDFSYVLTSRFGTPTYTKIPVDSMYGDRNVLLFTDMVNLLECT